MEMTINEILDYVVRFNGMEFDKESKVEGDKICHKLINLIKKAGFEFATVTCGDISHYRLKHKDSYDYDEVRIALREKTKQYGYGRHAKYVTIGYRGFVEVKKVEPSINPHTNEPWKIGDIDYSNPLQPILTRDGWYTGD